MQGEETGNRQREKIGIGHKTNLGTETVDFRVQHSYELQVPRFLDDLVSFPQRKELPG